MQRLWPAWPSIPRDAIAVSVVTVEEQLSGWYAQLRQAKGPEKLAWAYRQLAANVRFLARVKILDFDEGAIERYVQLKRLRLKIGKMDLQIAATALPPLHGFDFRLNSFLS
jgi:tRNA(fMet)-specific endonuclease VapC